jgi:uncharacterized protein (DUF362 family)
MGKGVGIHNQDKTAPVSLVSLKDGVEKAIELCEGLKHFDPSMKVLIKPNLAAWVDNYPYPPFGVLVTGVVLEGIVKVLKDVGAKDITIGEGSVEDEEWGSGTDIIFKRLGYQRLVKRYGVKLVDFNKSKHERVKFGNFSLRVAPEIFATDFCINVPVFKTHQFTITSFGFKNLKGVLHTEAKKLCHHHPSHSIDEYVYELGTKLYPHLNIVDGVYFLERGAMHTGRAHRAEVILAGRDMFSCDVIGSHMVGVKDISRVEHLSLFAKANQRSLDPKTIEVRGLSPDAFVKELENKPAWSPDGCGPLAFKKQNIQGLSVYEPDRTLCTGAGFIFPALLVFLMSANKGLPFDDYEFLIGRSMKPSGHAKKTFLIGKCAIATNRKSKEIKEVVEIPGCCATIDELFIALKVNGIEAKESAVKEFLSNIYKRYQEQGYPIDEYYIS